MHNANRQLRKSYSKAKTRKQENQNGMCDVEWRTFSACQYKRLPQNIANNKTAGKLRIENFISCGVRPDMNTYDIIASIHTGSDREHQGPAFFSWHRIYLLLYEAALQAVFGRDVTVPYWDSSCDQAMGNRQNRTFIFSNKYFGTPFGYVTEGFFANLPGKRIIRCIGAEGGLTSKNAIAAVLSRTSHSQIVQDGQRRYFFEGYHNIVHRWVDGTMAAGLTAAFDPMFWCHHAFVDYVWELFRIRIRNAPADYPLGFPLHPPEDLMNFRNYRYRPNPPITNREGYSSRYAHLRHYEPAPSCQNHCSNSPDLYCNRQKDICISLERVPEERYAKDRDALCDIGTTLGVDNIPVGSADSTTTMTALQRVEQAVLQDFPACTPLKLFKINQIDPNARGISIFDV
ncbi:TYR [Mytilus coruscus]|uniref:TYR n=1 Tax=Mytilus coruscus TaxID=42192 RepID=A0A6J8DQJ1_MYTCO|nr:TYR [Mytilus coruscus]